MHRGSRRRISPIRWPPDPILCSAVPCSFRRPRRNAIRSGGRKSSAHSLMRRVAPASICLRWLWLPRWSKGCHGRQTSHGSQRRPSRRHSQLGITLACVRGGFLSTPVHEAAAAWSTGLRFPILQMPNSMRPADCIFQPSRPLPSRAASAHRFFIGSRQFWMLSTTRCQWSFGTWRAAHHNPTRAICPKPAC